MIKLAPITYLIASFGFCRYCTAALIHLTYLRKKNYFAFGSLACNGLPRSCKLTRKRVVTSDLLENINSCDVISIHITLKVSLHTSTIASILLSTYLNHCKHSTQYLPQPLQAFYLVLTSTIASILLMQYLPQPLQACYLVLTLHSVLNCAEVL